MVAVSPGDTELNTKTDIAEKIYDEFETRSVARVKPTQGTLRNEKLTYWADNDGDGYPDKVIENEQDICITGEAMLVREDGNGNCQAWSWLFNDILRSHGFEAQRYLVVCNEKLVGFPKEDILVVKNVHAGERHPDQPQDKTPYGWIEGNNLTTNDPQNAIGIPGQGGTEPGKLFGVHFITQFEERIFDPSYGTPSIGGADRIKKYEDQTFAYFGYSQEVDGLDGPVFFLRPNDTADNSDAEVDLRIPLGLR